MIDDEGERELDRGHQGLDAWARRQADGELANESTTTDPDDTPPTDPVAATSRPDSDPEREWDAGAGDRAERDAFAGEGSYSAGRFAGER